MMNSEVIEECSEYKYLGVIFSTRGQRFKNNFTYLAEKGTRAVITTKTCVHSAVGNELPTSLHFKIFNQQVRPIMKYACEIWFQEKPVESLERIQLKYLKERMFYASDRAVLILLYSVKRDNSHCS